MWPIYALCKLNSFSFPYSTDTSSQFSVDIVEVAPRGLELEETSQSKNKDPPAQLSQQDDGGESAVEGKAYHGIQYTVCSWYFQTRPKVPWTFLLLGPFYL